MIDSQFKSFAEDNLDTLDELCRIYAEYRVETCEAFWDATSTCLRKSVPEGYRMYTEGKPFNEGATSERICGWTKNITDLVGREQAVFVGFGNSIDGRKLADAGWPIERPWTGIKVYLDPHREEEKKFLVAFERKHGAVDSEPRDSNWLLWRYYSGLQRRIMGLRESYRSMNLPEARTQQTDSIKNELNGWVKVLEEVLS